MSARDYQKEAEREIQGQESARRWVKARIEVIHERVTAHDVLRRFGVNLRYGEDHEEQFSCPFHGQDNKPSARVYPASVRGPSHAWCFVCQERWDVLGLWKKFTNFEGRFTRLLSDIEREYGIIPPDSPPIDDGDDGQDEELLEVLRLFDICERRLKGAKRAFDMRGFLVISSILDRLYYQLESGGTPYEQLKAVLGKVLDKIGEKVRACPDD